MTALPTLAARQAAAETEAAQLAAAQADPAAAAALDAEMAALENQSQATDPDGARAQAAADLDAWTAEPDTEMEAG